MKGAYLVSKVVHTSTRKLFFPSLHCTFPSEVGLATRDYDGHQANRFYKREQQCTDSSLGSYFEFLSIVGVSPPSCRLTPRLPLAWWRPLTPRRRSWSSLFGSSASSSSATRPRGEVPISARPYRMWRTCQDLKLLKLFQAELYIAACLLFQLLCP